MNRKTEMGICPACDNDDCEMVDMEMDVDCLWTRWRCKECGEEWSEYATLTYDGYSFNGTTYDADGKECTDI